jgi:lipoprotein-anchoring transpeptidase ErfK/SrfK
MTVLSRRTFMKGLSAIGGASTSAGCATQRTGLDLQYLRQAVHYDTSQAPGTIVVDPREHFLYHVQEAQRAMRYGVGVGGEGFNWSGVATIREKQEWPNWYPTAETLQRRPQLRSQLSKLANGLGLPGGPDNPLGARALYLWKGNTDTLYRIHGTNEPWTIGKSVSAGCIRMINQHVVELYENTPLDTKVVVLAS